MKKYIAAIVFTALVGAALNSWAATTNDQIETIIPVTLKATLTDTARTKINETNLQVAEVRFIRGTVTGDVFTIIGKSISLLTTTNGPTNTILQGTAIWAETAGTVDDKGKFVNAFGPAGDPSGLDILSGTNLNITGLSNSVLVITGTEKESHDKTNLSAKVVGVWNDGHSAVSGSIKNNKK
jgi:hypothetical protein